MLWNLVSHRLNVSKNRILKKIFLTKRNWQTTGVNCIMKNFINYTSANNGIQPRIMKWKWSMHEFEKKYISGGKTCGEMSTRKTTLDWMDNIDINLNEIGWVGVDLIRLVEVICPVVGSCFSWENELLASQQTSTPWSWLVQFHAVTYTFISRKYLPSDIRVLQTVIVFFQSLTRYSWLENARPSALFSFTFGITHNLTQYVHWTTTALAISLNRPEKAGYYV